MVVGSCALFNLKRSRWSDLQYINRTWVDIAWQSGLDPCLAWDMFNASRDLDASLSGPTCRAVYSMDVLTRPLNLCGSMWQTSEKTISDQMSHLPQGCLTCDDQKAGTADPIAVPHVMALPETGAQCMGMDDEAVPPNTFGGCRTFDNGGCDSARWCNLMPSVREIWN